MNKKQTIASLALSATLLFTSIGMTAHAASTYTVKSGDVLWKIASNNKVTVANIKEWNGLKSDTIYVGQSLYVQKPSTSYKVKSGDTLYKISVKYKTTVQAIKSLNGLKSDEIRVGQTLKIPTTNVSKTHTVQKGESLSVIAKMYGTTVKEIKRLNGLTSDTIQVGQKLKVSESASQSKPSPSTPTFLKNGKFPLPKGSYTPFEDTWNASRTYGGDRGHEGTDIMAPKGTKIYSATDGKIVNFGWSELGGWRISIKTSEGYHLYYAHMSKYAKDMKMGTAIKKGQLIGYVGNTGYGPEGTSGKFETHLHVGLYDANWKAMNSYNHLKYWETLK